MADTDGKSSSSSEVTVQAAAKNAEIKAGETLSEVVRDILARSAMTGCTLDAPTRARFRAVVENFDPAVAAALTEEQLSHMVRRREYEFRAVDRAHMSEAVPADMTPEERLKLDYADLDAMRDNKSLGFDERCKANEALAMGEIKILDVQIPLGQVSTLHITNDPRQPKLLDGTKHKAGGLMLGSRVDRQTGESIVNVRFFDTPDGRLCCRHVESGLMRGFSLHHTRSPDGSRLTLREGSICPVGKRDRTDLVRIYEYADEMPLPWGDSDDFSHTSSIPISVWEDFYRDHPVTKLHEAFRVHAAAVAEDRQRLFAGFADSTNDDAAATAVVQQQQPMDVDSDLGAVVMAGKTAPLV